MHFSRQVARDGARCAITTEDLKTRYFNADNRWRHVTNRLFILKHNFEAPSLLSMRVTYP